MSTSSLLVVLIPVIVLEFGLAIFSLIHVLRHPNYKFGNKIMWAIIVLVFQIIGPIAYFVFGRGEE